MSFPVGWNRVCPLVIQHGQVTANQTGLPVLITNASGCLPAEMVTSGGGNAAQSDGGDIRFTTDLAGSNRIACDIVNWVQNATAASATAEIRVPVDVLAASDVTIYVWYNAGGGQSQPAAGASFGSQAVYDSNYRAIYHLETIGARPSGTSPDSTSHGNTVINSGSGNSTTTAGPFASGGNAGFFAGDHTFLVDSGPTGLPTGSGVFTLEGWFKRTANTSAQEFFGWGRNSGGGERRAVYWQNDGKLYSEGFSANSTFPWTADTNWHHVVFTLPSGTTSSGILGYLDGVPQTMTADGNTLNLVASTVVISGIAGAPDNNGFFGSLDEIRISNIARSSSWIATQYHNESAPGSFIIAGTPQPAGTLFGYFNATAEPTADFLEVVTQGSFVAVADPRVSFTQGTIIFTASPLASFAPIDNAYSEMGFTGTASPLLTFTPDATGISIVATGAPQLMWFVPIGQSEHCASGTGVGARDSTPTNYVF